MLHRALLFFVLLSSLPICVAAQQRFVANLSGLQAVPQNQSTRKWIFTAALNAGETGITFTSGDGGPFPDGSTLTVHTDAAAGQTSPAVFSRALPTGTFGVTFAVFGLSSQDIGRLRSNRWYIQVLTPDFPNGEIRGQIKLANGTYNDYDGDGRTDLQVYRSSGNTFFAQRSTLGGNDLISQQLGQPGDSVSLTVDWDGDGLSDFSTARYNAEALWRIIPSSTGALQETRWGSSTLGDFFAAADFDGDGKFDIAVFRAGVWHIIESSTGNYRYEYWGTSGDVPAANDFDKDGKADLTVARSENGQRMWYTRFSSNGTMRAVTWGLSSDGFFTGRADFDGDGIPDISVIRNESGQRVFYILRSSDSQLQVIRWGLSSDVVKLGDYDGDGKTDPAVTRSENGQRVFYILQSSNGQPRYEAFGLQGDF
jgi:hypothetical protein